MSDRAAYDAIAEWYDTLVRKGGLIHDLVLPTIDELMGDVAGQRICDLACGQGLVARQLAKQGAKVIAVDLSSELIKIARRYQNNTSDAILYVQGDAQALPLQSELYDGVICNMALMDIPDLAATFLSVQRMLRRTGWFIFSITHPCLEISRAQSRWMVEPTDLREVNSYFVEGPWHSDNPDGVRGRVAVYHRTLSTYVNTVRQAGLTIERLVEPQAFSRIDGSDAGNPEYPSLLVILCKKPTVQQAP
jgi:2-polyprenyl-3-methyl-5-hydroxy-6-metoxy-1,4-benzoquinol methylase